MHTHHRRRQSRRRDGRVQSAEAGAGARRTALHRRHHARRIQKHIEKDAALARRFQPVFVNEPTVEDTISILRGLKEKYELHHGVRITDNALVAAATLSNRYITDRFLPDKAIDLVDEAASRLRMQVDCKPEELDELDRDMVRLKIEQEALKKESDAGSRTGSKRLESRSRARGNAVALTRDGRRRSQARRGAQKLKEELDNARTELEQAQRKGEYQRAGESRTAHPGAREEARIEEGAGAGHRGDGRRGRYRRSRRASRVAVDRHAGRQDARRRAREAAQDGGASSASASSARKRPSRRCRPRSGARAPACRIRTGRWARSCSSGRPASARPS